MKKNCFFFTIQYRDFCLSQNVGIGTTTSALIRDPQQQIAELKKVIRRNKNIRLVSIITRNGDCYTARSSTNCRDE
jgi:hypothetical protein